MFLMEQLLLSKKTIKQKCMGAPNNLGVDPFPDPLSHFGAPWWPFWMGSGVFQAVSECPNYRYAGIVQLGPSPKPKLWTKAEH